MATAVCPDGHHSVAADYCDVCGSPIGAPTPATSTATAACPSCGSSSSGRFCEVCGHDSAVGAPVPGTTDPTVTELPAATAPEAAPTAPDRSAGVLCWVVTVTAEREFYDRVIARKGPDADRVEFPAYYPERRITVRGSDILIGKHSVSQGLHPEIDLGIAPADVGVSRTHATIHIESDGITITDLGSTNGTSLNGTDDLIPANVPIPLKSGDRIHLGGWTTIVISAEPG